MSRLTISLAALSATAMLAATAPAFAHHGGGGGSSHFVASSFSSTSSHSTLGNASHDKSSHREAKIRTSDHKSTSNTEERQSRRVHKTDDTEHKAKHIDHVAKTEHTRREVEHYKSNKPAPKQVVLVKKAPMGPKLTDKQFSHAKLVDGKGRNYDAMKKGWTDGKGHWWFGRFAWLYIDGDWYYGNSRWTYNDGDWSCEDDVKLACDNCAPSRSANLAVPVAAMAVRPSQATETMSPKEADEASLHQEDAGKRAAPSIKHVAAQTSGNRLQPTNSTVETTELPSIEAQPPVAAPAIAATDVADKVDSPVECKKFLPNLSLTITVPCSQ